MDGGEALAVGRIAAIYDVHGNFPALRAVLEEVEAAEVDVVVFGGDIVWGPWPKETLDIVRSVRSAVTIMGNADREVALALDENDGLPREVAEVNVWAADELTEEERKWLLELPAVARLSTNGLGSLLFCHGSPRSDEEMITSLTPDDFVADMLKGVDESTVVCGHTHSQFDRSLGQHRVINAGSVGLPYEKAPGAYWALFDDQVHLKRTEYEVPLAATGMRDSACPHVDGMFAQLIERPLDPAATAEHFESLRVKQQ